MSRITNALLTPGQAYAKGANAPMVDLSYGAQMGFASELSEWVSNKAYIQRNLFALLIEAPTGFEYMAEPEKWRSALRAMVERWPIRISGLNSSLSVSVVDSSPVGGAGEMHQDFVDVTRERSNPVFTLNEKEGRPIQAFIETWITELMMNPETKVAGLATAGTKPGDLLADRYSMTVLFIEPDILHSKVVNAWLCTNMFPKDQAIAVEGKRDKMSAPSQLDYDISFTAITQTGTGVKAFAQSMLDSVAITGANPNLRPAFVQAVAADVASTTTGYANQVSQIANTAVRV